AEDEGAREELSRLGLKRAAEFSWRRTAELTLDAYRQAAVVPSWNRRGGRAINKMPPKASFERHGRGGHSGLTTPSALSTVASQYFLDAQPPLLFQEGNTFCFPSARC